MKKIVVIILLILAVSASVSASPIDSLLNRLSPGLANEIIVKVVNQASDKRWFSIADNHGKPSVTAPTTVDAAMGVHWYLKHYAGVQVAWDDLHPSCPSTFPKVKRKVTFENPLPMSYYLNYCTHSYTMAFWGRQRWDDEIDWMALHGINMPLVITGMEYVWRETLKRLGYPTDKIKEYIAGPAFQAWWLMNNLEGWGGPVSDEYIDAQAELARHIVARMRSLGMEPVLPGYSGMVPHDAAITLGLPVADSGKWMGFPRPAFLLPGSKEFNRVADVYYSVLTELYGKAKYYSMDPFHEGGRIDGIDLGEVGKAIYYAMQRASDGSVWVVQGWQANPRPAMIDVLPANGVVCLDLQSDNVPGWEKRPGGYGNHPWLFSMLLNYGGNVGLFGKIDALVAGFERARKVPTLSGTALTMEGIDNNPVMFELFSELPWLKEFTISEWLNSYMRARYGAEPNGTLTEAWRLLSRTIYNSPADSAQQGTTESLFCARPADNPRTVSSWARSKDYYSGDSVIRAAELMASTAPQYAESPHFVYDFIDVARQAVAEMGRKKIKQLQLDIAACDSAAYRQHANQFLKLIAIQDSITSFEPTLRLDTWIAAARSRATTPAEANLFERNARTQITVWGYREAANRGGLHDYAHREWHGLLSDFYAPRWRRWFDARLAAWPEKPDVDFYAIEEPFTLITTPNTPQKVAQKSGQEIVHEVKALLTKANL